MDGLAHEIRSGIEEFNSRNGVASKPVSSSVKSESSKIVDTSPEAEIKIREPEFDIMLSYNWGHQNTVLKMRDSLAKRGFKVWMDVELMSGNVYTKMAEAVLGSRVIVSCVTHAYENSFNCKRELGFSWENVKASWSRDEASNLRKNVIPVFLEEGPFTWSSKITEGLKIYEVSGVTIDQNTESDSKWEMVMDELAGIVQECLSGMLITLPGYEQKLFEKESENQHKDVVESVNIPIETFNALLSRVEKLENQENQGLPERRGSESFETRMNSNTLSMLEIRISTLESRFSTIENRLITFQETLDRIIGTK
ncbi:hypothetical protein HK096_009480, partial [Nowakowskiella sp. JEL0078]